MAKKSSIEKNKRRRKLVKRFAGRARAPAGDRQRRVTQSMEERFEARLKLAELPRNSSPTRIRNRCEVTGRPRAYYRKLGMSRIALRELGYQGPDPGPREVELVRRHDHGSTIPSAICSPASATRRCAVAERVSTPGSKLRARVLDVLKSEGYIRGYSTTEFGNGRTEFAIELKYYDGQPVIRSIQRVSKPGRRVYSAVDDHAARRRRPRRHDRVDARRA